MKGVHAIINKRNSKKYIGESMNISRRWEEHKRDLNLNCHNNYKLQNDWNKFGEDNFEFRVLITLSPNIDVMEKYILLYTESKIIKQYNTIKEGYNIEDSYNEVYNGNKEIEGIKDKSKLKIIEKWFSEGRFKLSGSVMSRSFWTWHDILKKLNIKKTHDLSMLLIEKGYIYKDFNERGKQKWNKEFINYNGKYDEIKLNENQFNELIKNLK